MMKKLLLCFMLISPMASAVWYQSDGVGTALVESDPPIVEVPVPVCDEGCGVEPVEVPSIGNRHAVVHSTIADYDVCSECHNPEGDAIVGNYTMLCSQYSFANPGRTIPDPVTGNPAYDPVSDTVIISGDHIAVLYPGDTVLCSDCHNPHRRNSDGSRNKVEDWMIHEGCMDCHGKDDD